MLQNKLQSIKGQLLEMMFQQHINMNTEAPSEINYENFYDEVQSTINEIRGIKDLSDLEKFCEEYGLNDIDNEMSFPNLVKQAYES